MLFFPQDRVVLLAAVACFLSFLMTGCGFFSQQDECEMTKAEIRQTVRDELSTSRVEDIIQNQIRESVIVPLISDTLRSPEGQKAVQNRVKDSLQSGDVERRMEKMITDILQTPSVQKELKEQVRSVLQELLQGGQQKSSQGS